MNRMTILLSIFTLGLIGFLANAAPGDRALPLDSYLRTLNGKPVKVGTLETGGTSVTNATTASTFTVNDGKALMFACTGGTAYVNTGASGCSASSTITASDFGVPLDVNEKFYVTLAPNEACVALIGASGVKCAVFEMR